jgi:murein DD-endopeptidase MepM/ murein hydrolase activator NlpD
MNARLLSFIVFLLIVGRGFGASRVEFVWPTPLTAWSEGQPAASFLQQAGSGDPASGGFGGVRSGGTHFHEGIDIVPQSRDRRGEPMDDVFAAMAGVVRHINSLAGDSGYGRYIVLEHTEETPGVYTLYAHLARIAPGLRVGAVVKAGQVLGTMGHSSGGYSIPKDRSHLHFEIGLMISRDFQNWYGQKKFGSANEQGLWNGMNLMGIDPLDFLALWRTKRVNTFQDYFAQTEPVVTVRIATMRTPDFVTRYPSLLTKPLPLGPVGGWEIKFSWTGLPIAWTPLSALEVAGLPRDQPRILSVNAEVERRQRSKILAVSRRGAWAVGKDLETVLQQLFGLR